MGTRSVENQTNSSAKSAAGCRLPAEVLEAEFDPRLAEVWVTVFESWPDGEDLPPQLGVLLRMAYLQGYADALTESRPGALFSNLGMSVSLPVWNQRSRTGGRRR